jgi:hypothetical protein
LIVRVKGCNQGRLGSPPDKAPTQPALAVAVDKAEFRQALSGAVTLSESLRCPRFSIEPTVPPIKTFFDRLRSGRPEDLINDWKKDESVCGNLRRWR